MTGRGNSSSDLKEVWEYDPGSDRWARKADMPETLIWSAYFVLDGKGYVGAGGQQPDAVARKFWEYDPLADRWTRKADFPGSLRFRAVGFSLNGAGYLCAGTESMAPGAAKVANDLWEYSPATDTWTRLPDFPGPARGAAVGFTLGPRVYIGLGADARLTLLGDFWQATPPAGGTGR